jgi:hypothetical protein
MRDPARIEQILNRIRTIWTEYPDCRFGQLLYYLFDDYFGKDLFFVEDDDFIKTLDSKIEKLFL